MIRLVAALLLVFLGTVHTWAGGDDGFFARPLLSGEYAVSGHIWLSPALHKGGVNNEASPSGAQGCCVELLEPAVSFLSNCMFANVIVSLPDALICPDLARGATSLAPERSGLDGAAGIFRPPII